MADQRLSPASLSHLESLLAKATLGPWSHGHYDVAVQGPDWPVFETVSGPIAQQDADIALTIALRNAAPALIAAARRVQELEAAIVAAHRVLGADCGVTERDCECEICAGYRKQEPRDV